MKNDIIIAAAGFSRRFKDGNKLLYKIDNKTILEYTIDNFINHKLIDNIILVYNKQYENDFKRILRHYKSIIMVEGGNTRTESVLNGLKNSNSEIVFVHDAARPFIRRTLIEEMLKLLRENCIVIPCIKPVETVRISEHGNIKLLNRDNVCIVQTPQCAYREQLMDSILKAKQSSVEFTDEAEYIVYNGGNIITIMGDRYNIKITEQNDIELLKFIIKENL